LGPFGGRDEFALGALPGPLQLRGAGAGSVQHMHDPNGLLHARSVSRRASSEVTAVGDEDILSEASPPSPPNRINAKSSRQRPPHGHKQLHLKSSFTP